MNTSGKDGTGARTVSYTCSYVPEEIILAAGLDPRRVIPEARPSEADAYMHPNTCYYVKSLLASGLAEAGSGTDAIVFANSCDGMRRLNDVWKEYVEAVPAFFIDVPKKRDPASIDFLASELRRFADNLEEAFPGSRVTDESLGEAIGVCNNVRLLMDEVFRLQGDENSGIYKAMKTRASRACQSSNCVWREPVPIRQRLPGGLRSSFPIPKRGRPQTAGQGSC
jgi:benzoyl-CoA reductase/2-hydroxyglutaryl-CoA dehydratase subunit BcrC/BadD/HgdB